MSVAGARITDEAERVQQAAIDAMRMRKRPSFGEPTITLPFGKRTSAKPYKQMRFSSRKNWWIATPWEMILPQFLDDRYKTNDPMHPYLLAWPNSQEDGTQMNVSGGLFVPVLWEHIDKTKGARVRTHEGAKTREGKGYVYWKRHILVWVDPVAWNEEHVEPVLRTLSLLAAEEDRWRGTVEEKSQGLAIGLVEKETVEVVGTPAQHRAGGESVPQSLIDASVKRIQDEAGRGV